MCPGRCAEHRKGCLDATNQQWPRTNPFSREEDGTMWNLWLFFSGQWCNGAYTIPHDWKAACGFWSSPWVCHRISGAWVVMPNGSSLPLSYFHLCLPIPHSNVSWILFEITAQAKGKSLQTWTNYRTHRLTTFAISCFWFYRSTSELIWHIAY